MVEKLATAKPEPIVKRAKEAPTKNTMSIVKCKGKCVNECQDKLYGKGMRAMNSTGGKSGAGSNRCTVCRTMN